MAIVLVVALAALGFAAYLVRAVLAADQGTVKMREIAQAVQEGAAAYLRRQFRTLAVFAVIVFLLLLVLPVPDGGWGTRIGRAVFFLLGPASRVGRLHRHDAGDPRQRPGRRGRPRPAATEPAFRVAFRTGGVVGMFTVGLGLLGAALVAAGLPGPRPVVLEGFGFGGALLAMFMRVGGGIFTKAADVGADLVGKVEAGIPEDDPRNAATIADNVGDNVGDCAGMAADLFESYAVTLVAAMILGAGLRSAPSGLVFPLSSPAIGVLASIVGILRQQPAQGRRSGLAPINRGFFASAAISLVLVAVASFIYLPSDRRRRHRLVGRARRCSASVVAVLIGVVLAAAIQQLTGYFTETSRKPVRDIGRSSLTGPATVDPLRHLARPGVGGLRRAAHRRRRLRRLPARRRVVALLRRGPRRHAACSPPPASSSRWTPSARSATTPRASPRCRATSTRRARGSSPTSTRSATPPRRSPRASRSPPRCSPRPRCSAPTTPRSAVALDRRPATTARRSRSTW